LRCDPGGSPYRSRIDLCYDTAVAEEAPSSIGLAFGGKREHKHDIPLRRRGSALDFDGKQGEDSGP
jgi:hypothetical protein